MSSLATSKNDLPGCGSGCGFRYIQAIDAQIAAARAAGLNVVRLKPMEYRIPIGQLGRTGYYGRWLDWLIGRYAGYGRNVALEIMNEPNHQLWPQQGPSATTDPFAPGPLVIGAYVAEMMNTARAVSAARGNPILIAGPGSSERFGADSRTMTNFQTLVPDTLARLPQTGWSDNFVWSHHNYADVERNIASPTRAEQLRGYLLGRWRGRGGSSDPKLWLTEGGARIGQAQAVDHAAHYSGLREDRLTSGVPRPVWHTFAGFPASQ